MAAVAPLWRVALADPKGTVLYVSSVTGAVVLDTTRTERLWNAVPTGETHWIRSRPEPGGLTFAVRNPLGSVVLTDAIVRY